MKVVVIVDDHGEPVAVVRAKNAKLAWKKWIRGTMLAGSTMQTDQFSFHILNLS